jgi:putative alpha-1,2-mannosidase
MPVTGQVTYARGVESDPTSGLWSYSDRSKEVVKPGYYATHLLRYNVDVELTATKRVGFHKYTFNQKDEAAIVFDLQNGGCWDSPTEAYINKVGEKTIEGYRYSAGWANDQRVFFVAEFSEPITSLDVMVDKNEAVLDSGKGKIVYARANVDAQKPVYVKVALSPTSIENAKLNMQTELPVCLP